MEREEKKLELEIKKAAKMGNKQVLKNIRETMYITFFPFLYSSFRKYAHPLHVKEGIITVKVFPVFSESFFGLVLA